LNIKSIADTIKERRRLLGIDQKTVAELGGISVHTLSNIESAKGNPSLRVLDRVLDALGLEIHLELKRPGGAPDRNEAEEARQAELP